MPSAKRSDDSGLLPEELGCDEREVNLPAWRGDTAPLKAGTVGLDFVSAFRAEQPALGSVRRGPGSGKPVTPRSGTTAAPNPLRPSDEPAGASCYSRKGASVSRAYRRRRSSSPDPD